jgi:hypothetical protein
MHDTVPPADKELESGTTRPHPSHKPQFVRDWRSTLWFPDDPGFVTFLKREWPDLLTIAILLIIPLILINVAHPAPPLYFALEYGGHMVYPQYAYPLMDEYITTTVSTIISFGVPFIVIGLLSQFLIGNFWDCARAVCFPIRLMSLIENIPLQ